MSSTKSPMDVDTSNTRDVWLVKVPKYLAQAWKEAPPKANLGKLLGNIKGANGQMKFVRNPDILLDESNNYPSEHRLTLQPVTHQKLALLSHNKETSQDISFDKVAFEGDVKLRGDLKSSGDNMYLNFKATTIKEAAVPKRTAQLSSDPHNVYLPRGAAQLAHEADMRKKKEDAKKTIREDKDVVQSRLFAAFDKQQSYNFKDLVKITNQTAPYLKEILKEICQYHKNMWELKPEYRSGKS